MSLSLQSSMEKYLSKNRSFLVYLLGQTISGVGDGLYLIAFMWFALELSGGKGIVVGGVFSIYTLNEVIFGLIAGPVADKYNKKKILVAVDILRGLIVLTFFIMTKFGEISILHLYIVTFFFSVLSPFFHRAEFAIVPQLVAKYNLMKANGFLTGTRKVVQIVAPGIGGILIGILGIEACFFLDALTYFASVLCILFVQLRSSVVYPEKVDFRTLLKDVRNGWRYLTRSKFLFTIGIYAACINFLAGPIIPLLAILSTRYSSGASGYGVMMSAISLGFIAASYVMGFIDKYIDKVRLMFIGLLISAISIFMFGLMSGLIVIVAVAFLLGVGLSTANLPITVLVQQNTPAIKIGVVSSLIFTLSQIAQPVSIVLGGFLANTIAVNVIFIAIGVILCSGVLVGFALPQLHQSDATHGENAVVSCD